MSLIHQQNAHIQQNTCINHHIIFYTFWRLLHNLVITKRNNSSEHTKKSFLQMAK